MTLAVAALALALSGSGQIGDAPQTAPAPIELDDVSVEGRRLRDAARQFVDTIAVAPAGARLGPWNTPLCVSVANLSPPYGQMMADRIGDIARDLGITVGEPGCTSNVLVIGTDNGAATAEALVEGWRTRFRPPIDNTNMGLNALQRFRTSDAAVRWWHVSLPVSADTGKLAARIGGSPPPRISSRNVSRLHSPLRYDLYSATVVIDMSKVGNVLLPALIDYTAMVVLAQVDPRADYSGQNTILNLFGEPDGLAGMSDWDLAYLKALYQAEADRPTAHAQEAAVANELERNRRRAQPVD
ncbi:hypothetical protein [Brevundimonas nasdae]|uniref:hypothetical protein n=1 Tax=Brevundimonas nasdae TaxID=172043 RepID=UPI003F68D78C